MGSGHEERNIGAVSFECANLCVVRDQRLTVYVVLGYGLSYIQLSREGDLDGDRGSSRVAEKVLSQQTESDSEVSAETIIGSSGTNRNLPTQF